VHLEIVVHRGLVTATLLGQGVHHDGSVPLRGVLDGALEGFDVVAVDGTDVADAEVLKEGVGGDDLARDRGDAVDPEVRRLADARQARDPAPNTLAHRHVGLVKSKRGEGLGEFGDRWRVAAPVVVKDHHHALVRVAEVVQGLKGHPARERPVADDRDHVSLSAASDEFVALLERDREPVGVGECGGGVTGLNPVVLALGSTGVARESAALAKTLEAVAAPGQELVDVGLVTGIPEQDVFGGFKDPVQGNREFDHSQVRAEVSARLLDVGDDELANLLAELVELLI
jgi:hypothetical protein